MNSKCNKHVTPNILKRSETSRQWRGAFSGQ
jgi:hypothetical protein